MSNLTENLVDSIVANDKESFMQAFNAAIANKVQDALEVKKVEVASSLVTPTETSPEEVVINDTSVETQEVE
jgi:hypothetical protein